MQECFKSGKSRKIFLCQGRLGNVRENVPNYGYVREIREKKYWFIIE